VKFFQEKENASYEKLWSNKRIMEQHVEQRENKRKKESETKEVWSTESK